MEAARQGFHIVRLDHLVLRRHFLSTSDLLSDKTTFRLSSDMLLSLPRELRDMIIEHVLLTPRPTPLPKQPTKPADGVQSSWPNTYDLQTMPPLCTGLLRTNKQLRHETKERACRIDIPLVLDIFAQQDCTVQHTWLSQPWGPVAAWKRLPEMRVQIRLQSVSIKLSSRTSRYYKTHTPLHLTKRVLVSIRCAVCSVLFPRVNKSLSGTMETQDALSQGNGGSPAKPKNSIARLQIDAAVVQQDLARDDYLARLDSAEYYTPTPDLDTFIFYLRERSTDCLLSWSCLPAETPQTQSNIECYPIMTHVGSIGLSSTDLTGVVGEKKEVRRLELGAFTRNVQAGFPWLSTKMREDLVRIRQEMGWDASEK